MRFLIVGLGSMGKRRVRCLQALRQFDIIGFDLREDRRNEVTNKYSIKAVGDLSLVEIKNVDAIIISTPPDHHLEYIKYAVNNNKSCFIEASVIVKGLDRINAMSKSKKIVIAPSCTMRFHQGIKNIKNIVNSGAYGKVSNFTYHCGQYLPDWHPWELVKDFYVSKKETGGAREIVPFELTWLFDVLGYPTGVKGFKAKTIDVGADIDDSYAIILKYDCFVGSMIIDVTSRFATRSLILNMEYGQLVWNWEDNFIMIYEAKKNKWRKFKHQLGKANLNYNKYISEDMYVDEIASFIKAIKKKGIFPNTLTDDIAVLRYLAKIESGQ